MILLNDVIIQSEIHYKFSANSSFFNTVAPNAFYFRLFNEIYFKFLKLIYTQN